MPTNTPFSGTAAGLSAENGRHLVDGNVGLVTSVSVAGSDGAVTARLADISAYNPLNPSMLVALSNDPAQPIGSGRTIQVTYPAQSSTPNDRYNGNTAGTAALAGQLRPVGGSQFFAPLSRPSLRARLRYSVYVPAGFDFRLGGKLPGLSTRNVTASGGATVNAGITSTTCRLMWKVGGIIEAYYYTPENTTRWGTSYGANVATTTTPLVTGWNSIDQTVWFNDIGQANGGTILTINGVNICNRTDLIFRLNDSLMIDGAWFNTFFGGSTQVDGDNTWETLVSTTLRFSDLYFEGEP